MAFWRMSGSRAGTKWFSEAVSRTVACIDGEHWPGPDYAIWDQLALNVRPDRIGRRERRFLLETLRATPMRSRMVELAEEQNSTCFAACGIVSTRAVKSNARSCWQA